MWRSSLMEKLHSLPHFYKIITFINGVEENRINSQSKLSRLVPTLTTENMLLTSCEFYTAQTWLLWKLFISYLVNMDSSVCKINLVKFSLVCLFCGRQNSTFLKDLMALMLLPFCNETNSIFLSKVSTNYYDLIKYRPDSRNCIILDYF